MFYSNTIRRLALVLLAALLGGGPSAAAPVAGEKLVADPGRYLKIRSLEKSSELDSLGKALSADANLARAALAACEAHGGPEGDLAYAEILLLVATGPGGKRPEIKAEMPLEELGKRAARLLQSPDPFVVGLAEWALSIRLGARYEGAESEENGHRFPQAWPSGDLPEWFRLWEALEGDRLADLDAVRQAAGLREQVSPQALSRSAERLAKRAESSAAAWFGLPANRPEGVSRALRDVESHRRSLEARLAQDPSDGLGARKTWMELRRAVRTVALAQPALPSEGVVFGLRNASRGSGNITVGRWNTHSPGGDIMVKRGLSPSTPAVPLLGGRLGPGHLRGLELSWEADKLVFAYVQQPIADREAVRASPGLRPLHGVGGYFGFGDGAVEQTSKIYEVDIQGGGLRQVTGPGEHTDQEPTYLPNGDIVFVSDRSRMGSQCAGALDQDNMVLNLYRCRPDGTGVRALSNNKDFDRHPHVLEDGRLLFLHWEYQERHLWNTHSLWTSRPDGSMADAFYKQHIESSPMSLREARPLWGHELVFSIACGHHNNDQGAVFIVDSSKGINELSAMTNLTPGVSGTEGGYGPAPTLAEGGVRDAGGHYMFPYPLSPKACLAAYSYKRPGNLAGLNFALYSIDAWGNKELLHRDKRYSVAYLAPLRSKTRPPVLRDLPPPEPGMRREATLAIMDVASDWPASERGLARYLRISQKVPWPCVDDPNKPCGFNDLHYMAAAWQPVLGTWDWTGARVIGIVPVETDGSAHFLVPAEQPVYFQVLAEDFTEIRRMRSSVSLAAGEMRSCVGCHESRAESPAPASIVPLALRRAPSKPEAPTWGDRVVPDFERDIQPLFDRHCSSCHGSKEPKGGIDLSARKIDGYHQSYRTLFGLAPDAPTPFSKGYLEIWQPNAVPKTSGPADEGKAFLVRALKNPPKSQLLSLADYTSGAEVTEIRQFGSSQSRLVQTLLHDPAHLREVSLTRDEKITLMTWIDLNAPYWGSFVNKDPYYTRKKLKDPSPGTPKRVWAVFPDPWTGPPTGTWKWTAPDRVEVLP